MNCPKCDENLCRVEGLCWGRHGVRDARFCPSCCRLYHVTSSGIHSLGRVRPELDSEGEALHDVIVAARVVQTHLWGEANGAWGIEEWLRMFRKRVATLEKLDRANPHVDVEARKRLLQVGALAVALMGIIKRSGIPWDPAPGAPPSNLPQFAVPSSE